MSAALEGLWSAAAVVQHAPRLTAALQPLIAAVTPAVSVPAVVSPAPTVPFTLPQTAVPTPATAPSTTTTTPTGLELPSVLLSTVVFATTVAALIIVFLPERTAEQRSRVRSVALTASAVALLLTLFTLLSATGLGVAATPDQLHEENATWISHFAFAIHYHLSADGVTLSLLVMSTLVFTSVFLAAWKRQQRLRLYCGLLLVLETAVNGALCATDLVLFVMFFAMQAVPLYLLIRCFGGEGRERSAARAGVAVLSSAALLLTGFLLVIVHSHAHSSDLTDLATAATPLGGAVATAGFWLVFTAFAIGFVIVPVHTWVLDVATTASSGVSALFAGVVVRLSGYGMIRFALGLFPGATQRFGSALMVLAVLSAVWGALLTIGPGHAAPDGGGGQRWSDVDGVARGCRTQHDLSRRRCPPVGCGRPQQCVAAAAVRRHRGADAQRPARPSRRPRRPGAAAGWLLDLRLPGRVGRPAPGWFQR